MVSMKDIADRLGVSKGTVSLVLSGKARNKRVSRELCEKILRTARELDYQPNEIARSLRTGVTKTIGVVVTDISNEFFGRFAFYVQERAKGYGYAVITTNTNECLDDFEGLMTVLLNRQVDGIIFVPVEGGLDVAGRVLKYGVPVVQFDRYYEGLEACYIGVNNYEAAKGAVGGLVDRGCRRVAAVGYDIGLNALRERLEGCVDALKERGVFVPELVFEVDYGDQEVGIRRVIEGLKGVWPRVDGVFFCSRRICMEGVKCMHQVGIGIPGDMEVLCFDEIEFFELANLPVGFVEQPVREMGELAVDLLMDQMKGVKEVRKCVCEAVVHWPGDEMF
jgi:LacI family transcriptional regulator